MSEIFLTRMKLAIYRVAVVVLFIAVLFPRAVPAGQHEMKRAALSTDLGSANQDPEQNQTQAPEQAAGTRRPER